jgi:hypothetical protein
MLDLAWQIEVLMRSSWNLERSRSQFATSEVNFIDIEGILEASYDRAMAKVNVVRPDFITCSRRCSSLRQDFDAWKLRAEYA